MTLVIVNKIKNVVSFSSDSRISFGTQGYIDFGIKVFSVPVKIYSPIDSRTGQATLDYDYKLGIAVVGNAINAYTVKESVYEVLQNLQYAPVYTNLSMDAISKLIFKVFEKTTKELAPILGKPGLCQLIVGGYCPLQKKIRIFKYSVKITYVVTPVLNEILQNDGMLFYGTGDAEAQNIYDTSTEHRPLHIIRKVIKEGRVPTVGGGLQYGKFVANNFNIYGVEEYRLNDDGSFKEYLYTLRGLDFQRDEFDKLEEGYKIAYPYLRPFTEEINQATNNFTQNNL